jgi:hypothetical protein
MPKEYSKNVVRQSLEVAAMTYTGTVDNRLFIPTDFFRDYHKIKQINFELSSSTLCPEHRVADQQRFDTDPDSDPTLNFDADMDPDPTIYSTRRGKFVTSLKEFIYFVRLSILTHIPLSTVDTGGANFQNV